MSWMEPKKEKLDLCQSLIYDAEAGIELMINKDKLYLFAYPPGLPPSNAALGEYHIKKVCRTLIEQVIDSPLISVEVDVDLNRWDLQINFTFILITGLRTTSMHKRSTSCISLGRSNIRSAALDMCHGTIRVALATERWLMEQMFRARDKVDFVDAMNHIYGDSLNE